MKQTSVFPKVSHEPRPHSEIAAPNPKPFQRGNTFSKSRDTREDRGAHQAKTSGNPQTLPHGRK